MLKAYLRRYDGTTQAVEVQHVGQHLGVHEGKVRFVRLFWDRVKPKDAAEAQQWSVLLEAVPLLDTLIVTRLSPLNGQRAVFHGTLTELNCDPRTVSMVAVDNPAQERLYDQPWWDNAPLYPSDQAAPELQHSAGSAGAVELGRVQTLGGQTVRVAAVPASQHQAQDASQTSSHPAARPGGHPAAPPAGPWQAAPQPAARQA